MQHGKVFHHSNRVKVKEARSSHCNVNDFKIFDVGD